MSTWRKDELLVRYDTNRVPWWVIQDVGGDVVALCETETVPNQNPPLPYNTSARVVAQWAYDPYGQVFSADHLLPHAQVRCGHKGLFFDRYDGPVASGGYLSPRLVPYAVGMYHGRNRSYNPQLGRWMQADPNEAALTLLAASSNGRGFSAVVAALDPSLLVLSKATTLNRASLTLPSPAASQTSHRAARAVAL